MASTDYRSFYDRDYIGHWDLEGKDITVTIDRVARGELTTQGGRKSKKPVVFFVGKEKGLALNKTNGKTIAAMYGSDTATWAGKQITLYPTTTTFGSEQVECIRIRPTVPSTKKEGTREQ